MRQRRVKTGDIPTIPRSLSTTAMSSADLKLRLSVARHLNVNVLFRSPPALSAVPSRSRRRADLRGLRVLSQSVALDVGGDVLLLLFRETVLQRSTHWKRERELRRRDDGDFFFLFFLTRD